MSGTWIVSARIIDIEDVYQIKTFETYDYVTNIPLYGIFFLMNDGENLAEIFRDKGYRDVAFASRAKELMMG